MVSPRKRYPLRVRTEDNIKFVDQETEKENPPSQTAMAKKIKCSQSLVNRIINKDLKKKLAKKSKVQSLNANQMNQRKGAARRLYEKYLAKNRFKYVVTLYEAYVYMDNTGGQRSIYYVRRGKMNDKNFVKFRESHPKGFMIVAAICYQGKVRLFRVEPKVKINSDYYSERVLQVVYKRIAKIYSNNDIKKVWFHQDKASSHFSKRTLKTLDQLKRTHGINYIPKHDIPVKSPDIAPMDFCVFGLLKQALWKHHPKDLDELWKLTQREWRKIPMTRIRNALMSWKYRCRLVVKRSGRHIENVLHLKNVIY